jgi:hypothetical protein
MRLTIFVLIVILISCNGKNEESTIAKTDISKTNTATKAEEKPASKDTRPTFETYSNKRFKNVTVERIGIDSFRVRGQGQIFEASFNWVLEDGHNELKKGFEMTDAGAPEWGKFNFIIHAPKKRTNSTLTLILFETSAKDGSRQHELPISLY